MITPECVRWSDHSDSAFFPCSSAAMPPTVYLPLDLHPRPQPCMCPVLYFSARTTPRVF
jgi:hypothetical protein